MLSLLWFVILSLFRVEFVPLLESAAVTEFRFWEIDIAEKQAFLSM
jgi:hypothetical protein